MSDDHIKHLKALQGYELYQTLVFPEYLTVEDWLEPGLLPHKYLEHPNAKIAADIKNSPLYKALK